MKIRPLHRKRLLYALNNFYAKLPHEQYTVFHFVKFLKMRLKDNKDAWIGVTGDTGVGKSYYVLMCQILFGRPMDLNKNVTYIPKGEEIIEKFKALNFQTLLVDEAAEEMRAVNWQSKPQQKVNVAAMTERFKRNAVFLNMPNFNEFTKSMRTGSILFRAVIPYRNQHYARVIIQRKSRNWRSPDPWKDIAADKIYQRLERSRREITNQTIIDVERKLPNTIMDFVVPNLANILPEVTDEYERLKILSREIHSKSVIGKDQSTFYKRKYADLLSRSTKLLYNNEMQIGKVKITKLAVATSLGISVDTLNKYLAMRVKDK